MSSDLQPIVAELQFSNYISIVVATAVMYDYIITFPKEISLIWNRPWTFVSYMFVLVRYLGLTLAMIDAFYGSTFIPGPILASMVLLLLRVWGFIIFLAAAEIVMILRVYAMYGQRRVVLGVLLVFYAATIVLYAISGGYYNNPNTYMTMTIAQVLNMSFCNPTYTIASHSLGTDKLIPRLILAALMFLLAVTRLCTEAYQTYKATGQWGANRYIKLLSKEGILYFLGHLLYIIDFGNTLAGTMVNMLTTIVMYILAPRFIMSVRDMYLRTLYEWDKGIDSGFGVWHAQTSSVRTSLSLNFVGAPATLEGDIEVRAGEVTVTGDSNDDARNV